MCFVNVKLITAVRTETQTSSTQRTHTHQPDLYISLIKKMFIVQINWVFWFDAGCLICVWHHLFIEIACNSCAHAWIMCCSSQSFVINENLIWECLQSKVQKKQRNRTGRAALNANYKRESNIDKFKCHLKCCL